MAESIDRLEVQVEAQATKANNQLDKLVSKLDKVSGALSGLNSGGLVGLSNGVAKFAQASSQLSNVKTADFTRLTKNIEKLSALNTQQIYGAAASMKTLSTAINSLGGVSEKSLQVAEVAKSISKLGGANVQRAIANLPALATAMNNLMTTLSRAPQVSNNIIQMIRALADLTSQSAKVGTAGNSLTASTNRIGTSMKKTTKKARSFSSVIGSIYQKYFWVMRAGTKLWDSVKSSMDYVEVLNYFDAAFGQVAESAVSQWEEAGADSAEAYYNSFSERAKQLTTKMTGFTITESGMLESTGGKSLGINPSTLMNYQAMFAQMSNSMGVTAETSLKLSTALTEIGADLASVKNMDFNKVWTDMASGLAGMSRTLDKYGANIRNVNLQQKLTELGINANITALNQNEKALLRTIILLDSTRYAWGDLADTIDKPANQLRLLKSNFNNLARTIGNIFLPIVAKVLPYINALVIALQRLAEWIVKLLGFEDFDWGGSGGIGDGGLDDLIGDIGDTEDGLDDATKAAKKLKNQLQGFDELNVISISDDSAGSGVGSGAYGGLLEGALDKILDEYQKAWDEAFDAMEARFDEFADNVAKAYKEKGLYGVGEYFSQLLTDALNNIKWEEIYEGAKGFGKGLAEFLNGLISPELFGAVGKTIASSLNTAVYAALSFGEEFDFYDLGASIASGINNFFATFDFASLADTLNVWVDGLQGAIDGVLDNLEWETIIKGIGDFFGNLDGDTIAALIGIANIKKFGGTLGGLIGKYMTGTTTPKMSGGVPSDVSEKASVPMGTAEGVRGLTLAFDGLRFAIDACVIAAQGLVILDIAKEPLIDMLGSMTDNQQKAEELKETYQGLAGTVQMLMDATVPFTSFFNGLPKVMGGSANASLAMSEALDSIANGTIYTDEQLEKIQKTWALTEEDIESLTQAMLDANPEVFEMTKAFESLDGVSFETLEDAAYGLSLIKDGTVDASEAFDEFRKPMWGMNEDALAFFETLQNGETSLDTFNQKMSDIGTNISDGLTTGALDADTDTPSQSIFDKFVSSIKSVFGIHSPAKNMMPLGKYILLGIVEGFSGELSVFNKAISAWYTNSVKPWFAAEKWIELWTNVQNFFIQGWNNIVLWWTQSGIYKWYNDHVKKWFDKDKWTFSGIKDGLSKSFNDAIDALKGIWDKFTRWLDENFSFDFNVDTSGLMNGLTGGSNSGTRSQTVPAYSVGGFPEDGLFYANHNELVGRFSNGKTAVANNEQIVDGIRYGVRDANAEQNAILREQNELLRQILHKEFGVTEREITKAVVNQDRQFYKRTGRGILEH